MLSSDIVRLPNLQLAAKLISHELTLGIQAGRRLGSGTEFEQFRHYAPGDDPRRIDWKRLAQTGHYWVRDSATESTQHIRLLLDLSGSMNYTENGLSRLQYARVLLASLAWLAHRQSDAVGLYALQNGAVEVLVSPGQKTLSAIIATLEAAQAEGAWTYSPGQLPLQGRKQTELLILASDFLQVTDEWVSLIREMAGPRRQIVIFQLLGDDELDFSLKGFYRFQDLETGAERELQAEAIAETVRQRAKTYLEQLDNALQLPHVQLIRVRLSEPVALVLRRFLKSERMIE